MDNVPKYPILVKPETHGGNIRELLKEIRPTWLPVDLIIKKFEGGLQNILYGCRLNSDTEDNDMIIFRVFGDYDNPVVNRDRELLTMLILNKAGCGQPVYCRFTNGIAYRYNPGVVLNQDTIQDETISRAVAKAFAKVKAIDCAAVLKAIGMEEKITEFITNNKEVDQAISSVTAVPDRLQDPEKQKIVDKLMTKEQGIQKIMELSSLVDKMKTPRVLTHSDPAPQNIIYDPKLNEAQIIDWEWGNWGNIAFDVGAYFAGLAVGFNIQVDKYPSREYQLRFIRWFLEYRKEFLGGNAEEITQEDVEEMCYNAHIFAMMCLIAGIFWGYKQAEDSPLGADFLVMSAGFKKLYDKLKSTQ